MLLLHLWPSRSFTRTHGLTVVCETKWDETKWKSVVCEMKICSLRNENLLFAKWESVVLEMKICNLRTKHFLSRCVYSDILKRKYENPWQKSEQTHRERTMKHSSRISQTINFKTDDQVSVISKGLKFIPTCVMDENKVRRQLLPDFECLRIFGSVFSLSIIVRISEPFLLKLNYLSFSIIESLISL